MESSSAAPATQDDLYQQAILEHGPALARLAIGYEAHAEQQRDLQQEIHLALWRSFAAFKHQCSLRTWVYRVAHNTAATHVLRAKRRRASQQLSLDELDAMPCEQDTERRVDEAAILAQLNKLIQQLKIIDRDVMLLYLEGLDAVETGEIVGISPDNVAQKVHRIKKLLQRRFHNGDFHVA